MIYLVNAFIKITEKEKIVNFKKIIDYIQKL